MELGSPSKHKPQQWGGRYRLLLAAWALGLIYLSSRLIGDDEALPPELEALARRRASAGHRSLGEDFIRNGHQKCLGNGTCVCDKGYTGELCNDAVCQQGCVHGECLFPGYCTCNDGFKGRSCDEPVCHFGCQHGKCDQPNHCKCEMGWFGIDCSQRCLYGAFSYRSQGCICQEGWMGRDCSKALCEADGCLNGNCIRPDVCSCHTGWTGKNCSTDIISLKAEEIMDGVSLRQRGLGSLVIHNDEHFATDTWRSIRKWTAHLDAQWKFGRTRFTEVVPANDTIIRHYKKRFKTCAAVGNSGGLKFAKAGPVIDMHDAVLRYNGAPSKTYEEMVGEKTTFRLLNRRVGDALLSQPNPPEKKKKRKERQPAWLFWRAESYHQYPNLRRKFSDEPIYLLHPDLLIPTISLFKELMHRIEALGIKWPAAVQSAPHGFIGIAFLIQICDTVDVYGFDAPHPNAKIHYHYFDKVEPENVHATEFEYTLLRVLNNYGVIRMCEVNDLEKCVHDDELRVPRLRSAGEDD